MTHLEHMRNFCGSNSKQALWRKRLYIARSRINLYPRGETNLRAATNRDFLAMARKWKCHPASISRIESTVNTKILPFPAGHPSPCVISNQQSAMMKTDAGTYCASLSVSLLTTSSRLSNHFLLYTPIDLRFQLYEQSNQTSHSDQPKIYPTVF